jgi:hypothetical protein
VDLRRLLVALALSHASEEKAFGQMLVMPRAPCLAFSSANSFPFMSR